MPVTLRQRVAKRARQRPAAERRDGSGGDGGKVDGGDAGVESSCIHGTQDTCAKRLEALMEKCFGDLQFLLDEFAKLEVVVSPAPEVDAAGTATDSKLGRLRIFTTHVHQTMDRMRDARSGRNPLSMPQLALLEEHIATSITPVKARLVSQLRYGSLSLSPDSGKAADGGDSSCGVSSSSVNISSVGSKISSGGGGAGGGIMIGSSSGSADDGGSTSRSSSVSSSLGGLGGESPLHNGGTEAGGEDGGIVCSVGMELNGHIFGAAIDSSGDAGGLDATVSFGEREPQKKRGAQGPSLRGSGEGGGRATDRLAQHRRDNLDILSQLEAEGVFAADDSYSPCRAGLDSASSHPFMLPGTPYGRDASSPREVSRALGAVETQGKVEGLRPFLGRAARQGEGQQKQACASAGASPIEVKRELWADERAVSAVGAAASPPPPPAAAGAGAADAGAAGAGDAGAADAGAAAAGAVGASSRATVPMTAVAMTTTTAAAGAGGATAGSANARTLTQEAVLTSSASGGLPGRAQGPASTPSVSAVSILPKQEPVQAPTGYSVTRVAHGTSVAASTSGVSTTSVAASAAAAAATTEAEGAPTPCVGGANTKRADAAAAATAARAAVLRAGTNGVAFSTSCQTQPQPLRSEQGPVASASGVCTTCVAGGGGRDAAPAVSLPLFGGGGGGGGMLVAPRQPKRRRSSAFPAALLQPREVRYQCGACGESYTATVTGNPWWLLVRQECQVCHKMQIPRVDILNPTNNVEGHIAFLTEACAENGADGDGGCMDWDGDTSDENSGDDCSDDERDAQGFFSGTFAGDEGEDGGGKRGLGPTLDSEQAAKLLVLMCHARGCPGNHKSPRLAEVCRSVKFLMLHLRDCDGRTPSGQPCPMPWCQPCTSLLHHLIQCRESASCQVCNPLHLPSPLRDLRILNHSGNAQEHARHAATLQETHAGRVSATATATRPAPTPFAQHAPDRVGQ